MRRWAETEGPLTTPAQLADTLGRLRHFGPLFGRTVGGILPLEIQAVLNGLAARNPRTGRPAAAATVAKVKSALGRVMEFACDNRALAANPVRRVRTPQGAPARERRALPPHVRELIRLTPHRMRVPAMIAMYAGLRRSEIGRLTWEDVNTDTGSLRVRKSKTAAGVRTVYMPDVLTEFLSAGKGTGLVARTDDGRPLSAHRWTALFRSYVRALNSGQAVPFTFTMHELRHTYSSLLAEAGVNDWVRAGQMGHGAPEHTDRYTHVSDARQEDEIRARFSDVS